MMTFTLAISFLVTSNLPNIHEPNIPGSCTILLFTALDLVSITSHMYNWVLFLLWLCLFIYSRFISPVIFSSILGTYWPGEFIFQCPIFLPFHTLRGLLKAGILKRFAIPFSSGPHFVRTLRHDPRKPSLKDFEYYLASMWNECNCAVVWTSSGIDLLWDWNENWSFLVLWPLLSFSNLLMYSMQHLRASSYFRIWNSSAGIPSLCS